MSPNRGGTEEIADPGVCPTVTNYLTLKTNCQGQKGLWPSFSFISLSLNSFIDTLEKTTREQIQRL